MHRLDWLDILNSASQHLWLSLFAVAVAVAIGVPLGVWLALHPRAQSPVLTLVSLGQTVPALALFGLLLPLIGLGAGNALAALTLSAVLPIIRHTFVGFTGVDASVREAARALGMTPSQSLKRVEVPLAADAIVAGIQAATVACIGIVTIAAFVGAGGLGVFIAEGLRTNNNALALAGAIPAALLALGADGMLGSWQHALAARRQGIERIAKWRRIGLAAGAMSLLLLLAGPSLVSALALL